MHVTILHIRHVGRHSLFFLCHTLNAVGYKYRVRRKVLVSFTLARLGRCRTLISALTQKSWCLPSPAHTKARYIPAPAHSPNSSDTSKTADCLEYCVLSIHEKGLRKLTKTMTDIRDTWRCERSFPGPFLRLPHHRGVSVAC